MDPEAEVWSVEEWLDKIGMSEYAEGFVDNGYETIELISIMKGEDMDAVGVSNKQHRGILFTQARLLLEETVGIQPLTPSKASPVISLTMSDSVSPTTPVNISAYTEPWDNSSNTQRQLTNSGVGYSEPWNASGPKTNGLASHSVESSDGPVGVSHSGDTKPPPLPPPNKPKSKGKKPPPSPGMKLPEYKREDGEKGLTRLQLKLKIRDELKKDAIVLSEHPFCNEDGSQNEGKLIDLAAEYAGRFGVESLGVYDALRDVWRHTNNSSEFVTPSKKVGLDEVDTAGAVVLHGGPTDNYDEPFDTQSAPLPNITLRQAPSGSGSPKEQSLQKSQTLPPNSGQAMYEEPFDTVSPSTTGEGSPQKVRQVKTDLSKTLPSPKLKRPEEKKPSKKPDKSPHTSPSSSPPTKHGLGRFFKRKDKSRSQSVKEVDGKADKGKKQALISFPGKSKKEPSGLTKKHNSAENLREEEPEVNQRTGRSSSRSARASVAGYPYQNGTSQFSPRRRPTSSGSSGQSESDESPHQRKKYEGKVFQKFITPPTLKRNQTPDYASSSDEGTPPSLRRLREINDNRFAGSDIELNTRVDDEDNKAWLTVSKSYDNLADTLAQEKKTTKKKGFFQRFLNIRKSMTVGSPRRSKVKVKFDESPRDSVTSSTDRVNSLTASISMPDIASMSVFDMKQVSPSIPEDSVSPPTKPTRSVKWSPVMSPSRDSSVHHKMVMRGLSDSSTPEQHTIPVHTSTAQTIDNSDRGTVDSESPIPHSNLKSSLKTDSELAIIRSGSADSTKSLDGSRRPPPPPKPSKLGGKSKASSLDGDVSTNNTPSKPSKPTRGFVRPNVPSTPPGGPPPKPARTSIKRPGVTEQVRKELKETDVQGSPKEEKTVRKPPPKPSRNYKSVKILSDSPSPPQSAKSKTLDDRTSSTENIKPSELLRRSKSPMSTVERNESPDHTPQGSEVKEDRPIPKPRPSVGSLPGKPAPPTKPPRKSIKLK